MIAENNEILTSASKTLYEYNSNWLIRERCRAREDYEAQERATQQELAENKQALKEKDQIIAEKDQTITEQAARIKELEALLDNQNRK